MTTVRPIFLDGAVLAAQDLASLESTGRDRSARHARHLHTPGVASGLELVGTPGETADGLAYVDVTLSAGYAVDGTGRELVVAGDQQLSPDRFLADNPAPRPDPAGGTPTPSSTTWHPVFIRGVDGDLAGAPGPGTCANTPGQAGVEELVEVEFGLPGDSDLEQAVPTPDSGQGNGTWRVLVGFVKLDTVLVRFTAVATSAAGGTASRAGARASLVAGSGLVEMRTGRLPKVGTTALLLDGADGGSLTFGSHDGSGAVTPLLSVDKAGNVTAKGTIKGIQAVGSVRVSTGVVTDGMVVPLPEGVDPAAVESGALEVALMLTPVLPDPATGPGGSFVVEVCEADDDRRLTCAGVWLDVVAATTTADTCSARFLLLVTVAQDGP